MRRGSRSWKTDTNYSAVYIILFYQRLCIESSVAVSLDFEEILDAFLIIETNSLWCPCRASGAKALFPQKIQNNEKMAKNIPERKAIFLKVSEQIETKNHFFPCCGN